MIRIGLQIIIYQLDGDNEYIQSGILNFRPEPDLFDRIKLVPNVVPKDDRILPKFDDFGERVTIVRPEHLHEAMTPSIRGFNSSIMKLLSTLHSEDEIVVALVWKKL